VADYGKKKGDGGPAAKASTIAQRRGLTNSDGGQRSRRGSTTQQPTIDRSIRGAVTLVEAPSIVLAEARVPPPPLTTAVVIDKGGGGIELTAPMAASLTTAEAVGGGGGDGVVAASTKDNN
jgi:hypothetical protein